MSELTWQEIEELASEDPDDRQIRLAHGFGRDADFREVCYYCGLSYGEISGGKIRECTS